MKCCQCGRPAMFLVGDKNIPLCLDCNLKLVQMTTIQNEMLERGINYCSDYTDPTMCDQDSCGKAEISVETNKPEITCGEN